MPIRRIPLLGFQNFLIIFTDLITNSCRTLIIFLMHNLCKFKHDKIAYPCMNNVQSRVCEQTNTLNALTRGQLAKVPPTVIIKLPGVENISFNLSWIKAVTSCSTHKIDQQETDGKNSKIRQSRS